VQKGSEIDTLYSMLIDKDIRYYVHAGSFHIGSIDYLVLLLENDNYASLAIDELKKLPRDELVTLLGYLKYPHYSGTPVEGRLLQALAGREAEIAPESKELLKNLEMVQWPRMERYERRLIDSEVEVFSPQDIAQLPGGKRQANAIRGRQLEMVVAKTRPGRDYLRSRMELFQAIVRRSEKAKTDK
jgi:hypothetical protein